MPGPTNKHLYSEFHRGLVPYSHLGTGGDGSGDHVLLDDGTWGDAPGVGGPTDAYDLGSLSGAESVDWANGTWQYGTLTADVTFSFAAVTSGKDVGLTLEVTEDGTGGWAITWPGSVTWLGGTEPTHDTTAGTTTVYAFLTRDGGTSWIGGMLGAGGGTPATTVTDETTWGITPAVGTDTEYARQDHTHGSPPEPAAGGVGPILVTDTPAGSPLIFADLLQNDAGTDLLYADAM